MSTKKCESSSSTEYLVGLRDNAKKEKRKECVDGTQVDCALSSMRDETKDPAGCFFEVLYRFFFPSRAQLLHMCNLLLPTFLTLFLMHSRVWCECVPIS